MALTKLSEKLKALRTDRPDEWTMDEFYRDAVKLESKLAEVSDPKYWYRNYINLENERDHLKAKLSELDGGYTESAIKINLSWRKGKPFVELLDAPTIERPDSSQSTEPIPKGCELAGIDQLKRMSGIEHPDSAAISKSGPSTDSGVE